MAAGTKATSSRKLGWVDTEGIYLLPDTAYEFASERLRHRGGVSLSERALKKMLEKDGVLIRKEEGRLESKPRCEGKTTRVLWLRPDALGELPSPNVRTANCTCGAALSSGENETCPHCGWLVCGSCGFCNPECGGGDR